MARAELIAVNVRVDSVDPEFYLLLSAGRRREPERNGFDGAETRNDGAETRNDGAKGSVK